jgi:hypothetical protein
LHQELHELPPCPERLFGVLLDLRYALPERHEPCVRCRVEFLVLALLGEVGFHGSWQEIQVVGMVLEVGWYISSHDSEMCSWA